MNINEQNMAAQEFWDSNYDGLKLEPATHFDPVRHWLETYVPNTETGSAFELGCFPGRFLAVLGELGYELHGTDLTPRTNSDLVPWLKQQGYRVGDFLEEDFFSMDTGRQYSISCSFGFIEHFPNWDEVLHRQMDLVEKGGYVVVTTPNFRGAIQRTLHYLLDHENYKRHNILSMDPEKWAEQVRRRGFRVLYSGYFSEFSFWTDTEHQSAILKGAATGMRYLTPTLAKILPRNVPLYAPHCGLIAKRV